MDMANSTTQMGTTIKVNGKMTFKMEKGCKNLVRIFIKAIFSKERKQEKVNASGEMAAIIKGLFLTVYLKEEESISGLQEGYIREIGIGLKCKVKEV